MPVVAGRHEGCTHMETAWQMSDPAGIQLSIYPTVQDVPPAVWAAGAQPGALYGSASWFRLAEAAGAGLQYIVACQRESGAGLAVLPVLLDAPRPGASYDLVSR